MVYLVSRKRSLKYNKEKSKVETWVEKKEVEEWENVKNTNKKA